MNSKKRNVRKSVSKAGSSTEGIEVGMDKKGKHSIGMHSVSLNICSIKGVISGNDNEHYLLLECVDENAYTNLLAKLSLVNAREVRPEDINNMSVILKSIDKAVNKSEKP